MNLYSALYISALSLTHSDMPVCNKGITQIYMPPTHDVTATDITCSTVVLQCYRRQAVPMEQAKI